MAANFSHDDQRFMQLALRLALRGQGKVEPNPMVGAVVVKNGRIVGQGYHQRFGAAHAEVNALAAAGSRARGATLYVTLEPCCHWGKTPPCTDAILAARIRRVVVAMIDPFAKVRGRGVRLLRNRGLRVDVGLIEDEARRLNAPFIKRQRSHLPYIIAKWAQSIDGCVATASGESRWISSEASREFVQQLRGRVDAIVVGIGTALQDDPLLMARPAASRRLHRIATRIILDSHCRLPLDSQLLRTVSFAPVMIAHSKKLDRAAEKRRAALAARGVMTLPFAMLRGKIDLRQLLKKLASDDHSNILVEGGPEVMARFMLDDLIDEAHVFIAPIVLGGIESRHAVGGPGFAKLADARRFELASSRHSGPDVHLQFIRAGRS